MENALPIRADSCSILEREICRNAMPDPQPKQFSTRWELEKRRSAMDGDDEFCGNRNTLSFRINFGGNRLCFVCEFFFSFFLSTDSFAANGTRCVPRTKCNGFHALHFIEHTIVFV